MFTAGGLEPLLSSVMPVEKERSERKQEFDGQSDEVAQPGVPNGDIHLLLYAKYCQKAAGERV